VADLIRLSLIIIVIKGDVDGRPTACGIPGKALPVHYCCNFLGKQAFTPFYQGTNTIPIPQMGKQRLREMS